jgi:glycosyltransferase involved in cell wall biosynthesis
MAPTVTAIVPTYNRPELLRQAIASALAQTYDDLVVLVGDNGGSPLNEGVVRSFDDPRVVYVRNADGVSAQRNWLGLIARAETPLVASLHDDDWWEPSYLERTVPLLLEDPTVSIAFADYWCVDEVGERLLEHTEWLSAHSGRDRLRPGRLDADYAEELRLIAVKGAVQPAYAAVLRRQAVLDTDFPDGIAPIYDLWLAYHSLRRGEGFAYVPERLTNYRVWGGSLTAQGYASGQDVVFSRIVAENLDVVPVIDELQAEWARTRFDRARDAMADRSAIVESQREFRLATPYLSGRSLAIAEIAGRARVGWHAVRLARAGARAVRHRLRPEALGASGLPEHAVRPSDTAGGSLVTGSGVDA